MIQESQAQKGKSIAPESVSAPGFNYIELPDQSSQIDPLAQLRANISQLESLQSQLSFMVREIKSLTNRKR
jgi:hypothetical protein